MSIIVGLSGASSVIYGIRLLEVLKEKKIETDLILSENAEKLIKIETGRSVDDVKKLATRIHEYRDMTPAVASGSRHYDGMIIMPCSMKTISGIATGYADNLMLRSADVTLKQRRPLVLVARETPLNLIHLRNMVTVTEAGAIVMPAAPAFYTKPKSVDDLIDHMVGKVLDIFRIEHELYEKWGGYP
jgi:4-hydroxy-3-polyprenylbenzoate decarboxylase